ncbi:hypothetical protein LWI29_032507 [Acer saccharum]|uniref:Uncharacterized protein n=1 Tax=Acer saccharum TaxID=4024 RepID=A0AA39S835_ACESA|nr:hypothetical protein LWI29_032507 [Acer saccharum]
MLEDDDFDFGIGDGTGFNGGRDGAGGWDGGSDGLFMKIQEMDMPSRHLVNDSSPVTGHSQSSIQAPFSNDISLSPGIMDSQPVDIPVQTLIRTAISTYPMQTMLKSGREATTEAMARLNVWLRTESPPKRIHHRSGPFERKSWSLQGSNHYSRSDQRNWRHGAAGINSAQKATANYSGEVGRSDGKPMNQPEEMQILKPNTNLMQNHSVINATKDKTLSGDKTLGVNLSALKGKAVQSQEAVDEREKKGTMPCSSMGQMEMDQAVLIGPIVLPSPEGKRADQIREEGIQSEGKKGKFSEVVNQSSDAAEVVIPDDLAQS